MSCSFGLQAGADGYTKGLVSTAHFQSCTVHGLDTAVYTPGVLLLVLL
jgi:hypothetical protein